MSHGGRCEKIKLIQCEKTKSAFCSETNFWFFCCFLSFLQTFFSLDFPGLSAPVCTLPLLVLLLLLLEQFVDLPLGHGRVLGDDAVLVQARQQQQKVHCGGIKRYKVSSSIKHFHVAPCEPKTYGGLMLPRLAINRNQWLHTVIEPNNTSTHTKLVIEPSLN